ncbi:zinc finger CCCH domain-containing protein 14 [Culicoides brevitarsis]|uniref:zinc finger CCCH domain-containing protein 14 n=1 Tax=Culicoides brevitarsis TaxID=469753 RepID=UPI00307C16BA
MDNIGSEIGQKMRCAVKAKLVELGTGYIDDELPDYVMIMVANKRSKQQMIEDLSLFLGSNTQIFVTWLHEVLEKLQEVTLPQRKSKRRDSEKKKKRVETPENNVNTSSLPSITEVIKEEFIQRSKSIPPIEVQAKNKLDQTSKPAIKIPNKDEFDIPTISDIAKEAVQKLQHEKELQQLAELQKKIYIAKKQLEIMVTDDSDENSNDEFAYESKKEKKHTNIQPRHNSNANHFENLSRESSPIQLRENDTNQHLDNGRQRIVKLSAVRRAEREIYVPAFRRTETESRQNTRDRNKRERHIVNYRSTSIEDRTFVGRNTTFNNTFRQRNQNRSRSRSPKTKNKKITSVATSNRYKNEENKLSRKRIGSRILVVPEGSSSQEDHVSSLIKIKQRILTPENKQASRMLLLRAVSEAQKSAFTSKSNLTQAFLRTRSNDNGLTIEIPNNEEKESVETFENDDEEYVPVPVKKRRKFESEYRSSKPSTQFVVTLDNDCINNVDSTQKNNLSSSIKDRIGYRMQITENEEVKQRRKERFEQGYEKNEPVQSTSRARTISPISFNVNSEHETDSCSSHLNDNLHENKETKIKKLKPTGKFDDIPSSLSTVLANDTLKSKMKERCKFFPNCRDGDACEFNHPTAACNAFPSCKYGDKCAYLHPLCKFDQTCSRSDCQYFHTASVKKNIAPPLASSIFPSQNYKPISLTMLPAVCKFFPKCSNTLCAFYHPKPCRFGKQCNKIECNFYHQELPPVDKLKWISSSM